MSDTLAAEYRPTEDEPYMNARSGGLFPAQASGGARTSCTDPTYPASAQGGGHAAARMPVTGPRPRCSATSSSGPAIANASC